jgi:hypothetical protein
MDPMIMVIVATCLAAVAATASAVAAFAVRHQSRQQSAAVREQLQDLEKKTILREIADDNREALAIGQRVEGLAVELVALRRSLAIHQGGLGSEQQQAFDHQVSNLSLQVASAIKGMSDIFDGNRAIGDYGLEDLEEIHDQVGRQLGEVHALLKDLELKHTGVVAALAPFEEVVAPERVN